MHDLALIEGAIAERSKRFRTFDDRREHSRYMALALAGEVGELLNLVKKEWRGDPKGLDGKALLDEASDIFVYWTLFCHTHGWPIERVIRHANEKAERKIIALEAERAARASADASQEPKTSAASASGSSASSERSEHPQ
jgi:NTP pyrophosphatase (non-canonical NTP hydrolase)